MTIPFSSGVTVAAQNGSILNPGKSPSGFPTLPETANPHPDGVRILQDAQQATENQKRLAALNLERQKQMTADTTKLLALANELKMEMDKSTKDTLSMNVVRKAEQIEKLAHTVREKMRASIGN